MNDSPDPRNAKHEIAALVSRLKPIDASAEDITVRGEDLARLVGFVEKSLAAAERANELLVNAYSLPGDEGGIRFLSQDAVKLQWLSRRSASATTRASPASPYDIREIRDSRT